MQAIFITFPDLDLAVGQAHIGRLWWIRARLRVLKMESFICQHISVPYNLLLL